MAVQKLEESYHNYDSNQAHRHNYYEIIYFNESGGEHEIDFCNYPICRHAVHLIAPEQVHILKRKSNVTGYVLAFSSDLILGISQNKDLMKDLLFFESLNSLPIIDLSSSSAKQFVDTVEQIGIEYKNSAHNKNAMLSLLVCQLLILLGRNYVNIENKNSNHRLITEFKNLVKEQFLQTTTVSDYANMLCITPGHLNDTVKKVTGKNAKTIIQEQIILEAKRMLYHSNQSIKEIAFYLKFEDSSHFNRFFKKITGLSPLDFRIHIREKYH